MKILIPPLEGEGRGDLKIFHRDLEHWDSFVIWILEPGILSVVQYADDD